jgi:prepilin-type N-terminal cleavage/methylation domain-containing protein
MNSERKLFQPEFPGFSLLELLLVLSILAISVIPVTLLTGQAATSNKQVLISSGRSIVMDSLASEMSVERADFNTQFNNNAKITTISESGQTIPYLRKVDTSNSNVFKRTVYSYIYNNTADADNNALLKTTTVQMQNELRLRCGSSSGLIDSAGQEWNGDAQAYDAASKTGGYVTGSSGNAGSNIVDIVNTSGNDDALFQYYREGTGSTNVDYQFDVENADYIVKLYFAEVNATVTGSAPNRRLMDIYMEGNLQNSTAYSPYETTGGSNRGNIQAYKVTVSDGTLNVSIRRNASSNHDARISGIVLRKVEL